MGGVSRSTRSRADDDGAGSADHAAAPPATDDKGSRPGTRGRTGPPDGRSTRWDAHKARRREHILTSAIAAIDRDGSAVGVGTIAAQADLPRSVVYRHFADRGDLDEAIRARILTDLLEVLTPVFTPAGTVREAITEAVDTYLTWISDHPRLHQFLSLGSATRRTTDSKAVTGTKTALAVRLGAIISTVLTSHGADDDIAETLAFALIGMVDAPVNRWIARPEKSIGADGLGALLGRSIWLLLDGNLRALGVEISPDTPAAELW